MTIKITRVEDSTTLSRYMSDISDAIRKTLGKTGSHGTNAEVLMRSIVSRVGSPNTYLLVGENEKGFAGVLFSYYMPETAYVEVPVLWARPGMGIKYRQEVFDMLRTWAKERGATAILSCVVRDYEKFVKWFHEPLGFKVIGVLVEAKV